MRFPTAIVTGAAGFLGSHLAEHLLKNNYAVLGLDNFSTGLKDNAELLKRYPNFYFIECDVAKDWDWKNKIPGNFWEDLRYIFHFASPASPKYFSSMNLEIVHANTVGLENCLKHAAPSARVIFASTSEIYGNPQVHPQSENYWGNVNSFGPRSCYNESKRLGESLIYAYNERFGKRHGLVRIFNTYGPRIKPEDGRVVIEMLSRALQNKEILVHGDGKQKRSLCFVTDLISGIFLYAEKNLTFPINLGNSEELEILQLAEVVKEVCNKPSLKTVFGDKNPDDPIIRRPDLTLAEMHLPEWKAQVDLRQGLHLTLNWLKEF